MAKPTSTSIRKRYASLASRWKILGASNFSFSSGTRAHCYKSQPFNPLLTRANPSPSQNLDFKERNGKQFLCDSGSRSVLARIAESWPTHLTRRKAEPIKEGAPLVQTC